MTKRVEQFILNEVDGAFDINRNKRISKEECIKKYEEACFDKDCTKVTLEREEECIKYITKFNDRIPLEITIDIKEGSKNINKQYLDRLKRSFILKKKSLNRVSDVKIMKFFIIFPCILSCFIFIF